jgi:hypothetical protein
VKKIWLVILVSLGVVTWYLLKKTNQGVAHVLPEKTVFFIDPELSESFQKTLSKSLENSYQKGKDPDAVIAQASQKFPEIASMKVQICQSDKICFYVDVSAPVFLLNCAWIVCKNGSKIDRDHFDEQKIKYLVSVSCSKTSDIARLIEFVQRLPDIFKTDFSIQCNTEHEIILIPKGHQAWVIMTSLQIIPAVNDLAACQKIDAKLPKKLKIKKKCTVYDIRFHNQIIVR